MSSPPSSRPPTLRRRHNDGVAQAHDGAQRVEGADECAADAKQDAARVQRRRAPARRHQPRVERGGEHKRQGGARQSDECEEQPAAQDSKEKRSPLV